LYKIKLTKYLIYILEALLGKIDYSIINGSTLVLIYVARAAHNYGKFL